VPRILCIYGNPKEGGFVHGCVDHLAARLEEKGAEIDRLDLHNVEIGHCLGCFHCLRTGQCVVEDDMGQVIDRIRQADGLVTGASVRNGFFPALFKLFYERLTYILGFGRELKGKHVLAVGSVGMATGRKPLGKLITFRQFQARVSGYLFFRTGIPTKLSVEEVATPLDQAAEKFYRAVQSRAPLSLTARLLGSADDFVIRKFMLEPNSDGVYDYVIAQWKEKGLM
jgi:multimeric flavodoxin WrbA